MTGWVGDTGSARLVDLYRERLAARLTGDFLDRLKTFGSQHPPAEGAFVTPIGEGGVWAALWNLGEAAGTGICVDLVRIPIRQETIEVCEILREDPYQLRSGGFLYLLADGVETAGTVIGRTRPDRDRIVLGLEGVRYLNRGRGGRESCE